MERGGILVGTGQVVGLSIHGDGQPLHYVHLQSARGSVRLLGHGTVSTFEELARAIGTRVPLSVVWDGPRCVHRVIARTGNAGDMLASAFPNAPMGELHFSGWTFGSTMGLSMMRREHAAPSLNTLRGRGFRAVDAWVGPWGLLALRELRQDNSTTWGCNGHLFSFTETGLTDLKPRTHEGVSIDLGGEELPESHALAWSAAWEHLVPSASRLPWDEGWLLADRLEERARVRYERGLIALAAILILLFGVERILHAQVESRGNMNGGSSEERAALRHELEEVRRTITAREQLVAELGLEATRSLADRAAALLSEVPIGILLDRLEVDPLSIPLRERERMSTLRGVVRISGSCANELVLNQWMVRLRSTKGVRDVRLTAYVTDPNEEHPSFELELDA